MEVATMEKRNESEGEVLSQEEMKSTKGGIGAKAMLQQEESLAASPATMVAMNPVSAATIQAEVASIKAPTASSQMLPPEVLAKK
jgi:hypothetical protein